MKKYFGKAIKKIIQVGKSSAITIPNEYLKSNNLKQGDIMEVFFNRIIHAEPLNINEIKSKLEKNSKAEKINDEEG